MTGKQRASWRDRTGGMLHHMTRLTAFNVQFKMTLTTFSHGAMVSGHMSV